MLYFKRTIRYWKKKKKKTFTERIAFPAQLSTNMFQVMGYFARAPFFAINSEHLFCSAWRIGGFC